MPKREIGQGRRGKGPNSGSIKPGEYRGGGRRPGSRNKTTAAAMARTIAGCTPLEFFCQIYRTQAPADAEPAAVLAWFEFRMEAARAALPYCHTRAQDRPQIDSRDTARMLRETLGAMDATVGEPPPPEDDAAVHGEDDPPAAS